jgi:hypothetical protein
MTAQNFYNDIINTNKTDYLSAIRFLLEQTFLDDDISDLTTLLRDFYNLPQKNIDNITHHYLNNETFEIDPDPDYEN